MTHSSVRDAEARELALQMGPTAPPWMATALGDLEAGVAEIPGSEAHPRIIQWFRDVGHSWVKSDEVASCAAFVGSHLRDAGCLLPPKALRARSYLGWGSAVSQRFIPYGAIVVLARPGAGQPGPLVMDALGHVGFFCRALPLQGCIALLGANQGDRVSVARYPYERILGVRWPSPEV